MSVAGLGQRVSRSTPSPSAWAGGASAGRSRRAFRRAVRAASHRRCATRGARVRGRGCRAAGVEPAQGVAVRGPSADPRLSGAVVRQPRCRGHRRQPAASRCGGGGPGAPQRRQQPDQEQGLFHARGALPRPQRGGHQGGRGACAEQPGQIARALVVMVIAGQCLRALWGFRRTLAVEDNRRRGLGGAGHAGGNKRVGKPGESGAGHAVCEPRARWGTRQGLRGIARDARETPRKHGSSRDGGPHGRPHRRRPFGRDAGRRGPGGTVPRRRRALVTHGGGQPLGAADLAIQTPQQAGANIRRPGPPAASARTVSPARGGKCRCSGVEEGRSKPLVVFTA